MDSRSPSPEASFSSFCHSADGSFCSRVGVGVGERTLSSSPMRRRRKRAGGKSVHYDEPSSVLGLATDATPAKDSAATVEEGERGKERMEERDQERLELRETDALHDEVEQRPSLGPQEVDAVRRAYGQYHA